MKYDRCVQENQHLIFQVCDSLHQLVLVATSRKKKWQQFNNRWRLLVSSDFGCMLLVGTIRFENRFCASRKGGTGGGGCTTLADSAWRQLQLPVEKPWSKLGGPFVCFLAQTGVENTPFTLQGLHFWHFRQLLVRSVLWSEGPDYWTLANECVCLRSWTHKECVNKALTQVSSASSKQKWKYGQWKVSIAYGRLVGGEILIIHTVSGRWC